MDSHYKKILQLFTTLSSSSDIIISPENYNNGKYDTEGDYDHEKYYQGPNIKSEKDYDENGLQVYYAGMVAYSILAKVDLKSMEKDEIKEHFKKDIFLNASLLLIESSFVEQCIVFNKKKKPNRRPTIQQMLDHPYLKRNLPENLLKKFISSKGHYIRDKKINSYALLGKGSFGLVNIVLKPANNDLSYYIEKKIAYNDALKGMALREVEINKIIRDNNITGCVQSFQEKHIESKNTIKIRMAHYRAIELRALLDLYGILNEHDARSIIKSAVEAYAQLHKNNIIVRDIKPGNIMVALSDNDELECKIIDFGNSKIYCSKKSDIENTISIGSLISIAPEVLGGTKYGFSSEVFSVGATFYRLLMGKYIMDIEEYDEKLIKDMYTKPIFIPKERGLSLAAIDLIKKCIQSNADKRIQSMNELLKHEFFDPKCKKSTTYQKEDVEINQIEAS